MASACSQPGLALLVAGPACAGRAARPWQDRMPATHTPQRPAPTCLPPPLPPDRYVFLLDARGRLRWRASGNPSEQELQTLGRVTEQLLREQGELPPQLQQAEQQAAQQTQPGGQQQQAHPS